MRSPSVSHWPYLVMDRCTVPYTTVKASTAAVSRAANRCRSRNLYHSRANSATLSILTAQMPQNRSGSSVTPSVRVPSASVLGTSPKAAALAVMTVTIPMARGSSARDSRGLDSAEAVAAQSTSTGM